MTVGVAGFGASVSVAAPAGPPQPASPPGSAAVQPAVPSSMPDDVDLGAIPAGHDNSKVSTLAALFPLAAPVLAPGTPVVHKYDIVVANLFESANFPPGPPAETMTHEEIDSILSDAAKWWSDNTKLAFDFNTDTRYETINTTCDTMKADAMAKMGKPFDSTAYTATGSNLLIFQTGDLCGQYNGIAFTVPKTGDVFVGGIFSILMRDQDSHEKTAFATAHEFGHTIGLLHSNVDDCRPAIRTGDDQVGPLWDGTFTPGQCKSEEYRDVSTIMGNQFNFTTPVPVTLNSLQKRYLGVAWDDVEIIDSPTTQQTITLPRYDDGATPGRGVEISAPDGSFKGALEYRPSDRKLWGEGLFTLYGVYLTTEYYGSPGLRTDLVVPIGLLNNVGQDIFWPVPLGIGDTYVSQSGTVRLRTISVSDTDAQVEVTVTASPGVQGDVSIKSAGGVLTADAYSSGPVPVEISYQWFRNGEPIAGATAADYTPTLPDPNAVFRVEAIFTADGHAATTRYSRGIIPDDQRLAIIGSDLTITLLDQNGRKQNCAGMGLAFDFASADGQNLGTREFEMVPTPAWVVGVCMAPWPFPLTGEYRITARNPVEAMVWINWHSMYWAPATSTITVGADHAAAGVMVGVGIPDLVTPEFGPGSWFHEAITPTIFVGNGDPPGVVSVSVTDGAGAPAAGVPVTLSSATGSVVFTPAAPVTDDRGLARATVAWDPAVATPEGCRDGTVTATVPGVDVVAGSPAPLWVCGAADAHFSVWLAGDPYVRADDTDFAEVRFRAWEDDGTPITDQADRLIVSPMFSTTGVFDAISVTDTVWDPVAQDYFVKVTSKSAQTIELGVHLDGVNSPYVAATPVIRFESGPAADIDGWVSTFSASNGSCDGTDTAEGQVWAWPVDDLAYRDPADGFDGGVVFSLPAGSPLTFTSNPVVPRPTMWYGARVGYAVSVTSSLTGQFPVFVSAPDGRPIGTVQVIVGDGAIDPAASTLTLSDGPVAPGGTDAYTLTANLVTLCHVPVSALATDESGYPYWARLDAVDMATGQPASDVRIGALTADAAHPGVYTAKVTAGTAGSYGLTLNSMQWVFDLFSETGTWDPVPVNREPLVAEFTVASTNVALSLLGDPFLVSTDHCTGVTTVYPDSLTATVTVTDGAGKPVVGAEVKWSGDASLLIDQPTGVTRDDGTATVAVSLDVAKWGHTGTPVLRADVNGAGAQIEVPVDVLIDMRPPTVTWTLGAAPTGADPVPADGQASWTVSAHAVNECGVAAQNQVVWFAVDGSALLSDESLSTDADGWARVQVTDTVAESVGVSVRMRSATGPEVPGSPVPVEFVSVPVVTVGVPVLGVANRTVISGTVVVGAGQSEPVSVQVTYPSTKGPVTVDAAVSDRKWSVATPADAVSGTLTLVARDAKDNASARVTGELVILALRAEVGAASVHRTETLTVTGFNFAAGEKVHLVVQSKELDLGVATADDNGKVVFTLKIPADFEVGDHTAKLTGDRSGSVSVGFKVLADSGKQQAPTGGMVAPAPAGTPMGDWLPYAELVLLVLALVGAAATGERGRVARQRHPRP